MTRDGALPPAGAGAAAGPGGGGGGGSTGAGDGPRRCSQCGHHGHNSRTCTARPVKLFGVRIGDKLSIRKSASMGNIAQLAEGGGGGSREEGYGSDGEHERPHKKRGEGDVAGFSFSPYSDNVKRASGRQKFLDEVAVLCGGERCDAIERIFSRVPFVIWFVLVILAIVTSVGRLVGR